jgi:hypothetical protein
MVSMMQGMNQMGKDMQGLLDQMNKMMNDKNVMNGVEVKDHMTDMLGNMKTMMKEYKGMLNSVEEMQPKGKGK